MIYSLHNADGEPCILVSDESDLAIVAASEDGKLKWMSREELEQHVHGMTEFFASIMRGHQLDDEERSIILAGSHPEAKAIAAADYTISRLPLELN